MNTLLSNEISVAIDISQRGQSIRLSPEIYGGLVQTFRLNLFPI